MARRLALLVNPASGRGRLAHQAAAVAQRLADDGNGVEVLTGADPTESAALARSAVADGVDGLVVMGGDGMVHLALRELVGSGAALGVVATGTGNDLARTLGLPLRRPLDAAGVITAGTTRRIDLARVEVGRPAEPGAPAHYATVLASGFDSMVSERANAMTWPRGQLRYHLATLAELRLLRPLPYHLEIDGEALDTDAVLVAVGNGPSYGGGIRICHGAEPDDGLLDVVVIHPVGKLELVRFYPQLFKGGHVTHPAYEHHRARSVRLSCPGVVAYADGERIGPLPVSVEAVPSAVAVYVPA